MTEECDRHLFQQLQFEAFNSVWTRIESTIKVLYLSSPKSCNLLLFVLYIFL